MRAWHQLLICVTCLAKKPSFLFSRHEVKAWLDNVGSEGLLQFIEGIRAGEDFDTLFND